MGEINLYVDGLGAEYGGWTRVGVPPYLDGEDVTSRIESNVDAEEIGEFTFEDTAQTGSVDAVRVAFCTYGETPLGTYDVFIYDADGGWTNVGSVTVGASYQRYVIDVSAKLNTWAKINGARMRLVRNDP